MLRLQPPATQFSVKPPTAFIAANWQRFLPDWAVPVRSVLIVLQQCDHPLLPRTPVTEGQKQRLRQTFLQRAIAIAEHLRQQGYLAEPFDPQTGLPLQAQPGMLRMDDVAVAATCLGYASHRCHGCSVLVHPAWGHAVYPAILVSSAPPDVLEQIASTTLAEGGWMVQA